MATRTEIIDCTSLEEDQVYEKAGRIFPLNSDYPEEVAHFTENKTFRGFEPFLDQKSFNLADWLTHTNTPVKDIDDLMGTCQQYPIDPEVRKSFTSAYTLRKLIHNMPDTLGIEVWRWYDTGHFWSEKDKTITPRNLSTTIAGIL